MSTDTLGTPFYDAELAPGDIEFILRGKNGARAEWSLLSATHNLLKLWRSGRGPDSYAVAETIAK